MDSLPNYDDWKLASGPPAGPHEMELDAQYERLVDAMGRMGTVDPDGSSDDPRYNLYFRDLSPSDAADLIDAAHQIRKWGDYRGR